MKNKERSSYTKFDIADFCPPLIFLAQSQLLRIKKLTLSCNQESHFYLALVKSGWKKIIQTLTLQWKLRRSRGMRFSWLVFAKHLEKWIWWKEYRIAPRQWSRLFWKWTWVWSKIKKKICKSFEDNSLNITIETNLHITECLRVTFNLKTGKYYPYRKQNKNLQFIHK